MELTTHSPPRKSRRGPKPGTVRRFDEKDRALFPQIDRLVQEEKLSATAATRMLAEDRKVAGHGDPTSRAKRLARLYLAERNVDKG
jgi:hypothetical protein